MLFKKLDNKKNEKYLLELTTKFEDFTNIEKISYIFADEVRKLSNSDLITIVEYRYSGIKILATIPDNFLHKTITAPHEQYLIIKTLLDNNFEHLDNTNLQSEHLKSYIPLYEYKDYFIMPVYIDKKSVVTLEIYGHKDDLLFPKKKLLRSIIDIYRKAYIQKLKFDKTIALTKQNEVIISFLDRIRNTLDENEIEKIILEEISKVFGADRVYFLITHKNNNTLPEIGKEFLSNPYVKSLIQYKSDFNTAWDQLKNSGLNQPVFVIESSEKFISQNQLQGTPTDIYIKKSQIKSSYPFLLDETSQTEKYLVIQFTKQVTFFGKEEFEIMELLSKQIRIALNQAKLHTELIANNRKERLLVDFINILRSSLEIRKVANEFTAKVGEFFNADRCLIRFFDDRTNEFKGGNHAFEYKKNYYTKSSKNYDLEDDIEKFLIESEKFHETLILHSDMDAQDENSDYIKSILHYFSKHKIKSYMAAYIKYNDNLYGLISLHFTNSEYFTDDDKKFLKVLSDQLAIAIYQSELYLNMQNTLKKEKLLKEIYADTIKLQTKEQIYKYFTEKLMYFFSTSGIVFVEFPDNPNEKLNFFENYKNTNLKLSKFKNVSYIVNLIKQNMLSYICDFSSIDNNKEVLDFLNETGIECIATLPISGNLLILAFFDKKREFNNFDKTVLFSIADLIAQILNDAFKTAEINNLRDTFISALTHDIQIPFISIRNAVNYLLKREENKTDKVNAELLNIISETNQQIEELLKIIMAIYKYESSKKQLILESCNILDIVENCLERFNEYIISKNIIVSKDISAENLIFLGDKVEITKAVNIILESAITDSENSSEIIVKISSKNNFVRLCISSNGKNSDAGFDEHIIDRNIIQNNLEHRVGEGLRIYLVKLILNLHNGKFYINNNQLKGHVFCIELEQII